MRHTPFITSLMTDPQDDTVRLVLADWLDEQGDATSVARADLIRRMIEWKNDPTSHTEENRLAIRDLVRDNAEAIFRQDAGDALYEYFKENIDCSINSENFDPANHPTVGYFFRLDRGLCSGLKTNCYAVWQDNSFLLGHITDTLATRLDMDGPMEEYDPDLGGRRPYFDTHTLNNAPQEQLAQIREMHVLPICHDRELAVFKPDRFPNLEHLHLHQYDAPYAAQMPSGLGNNLMSMMRPGVFEHTMVHVTPPEETELNDSAQFFLKSHNMGAQLHHQALREERAGTLNANDPNDWVKVKLLERHYQNKGKK